VNPPYANHVFRCHPDCVGVPHHAARTTMVTRRRVTRSEVGIRQASGALAWSCVSGGLGRDPHFVPMLYLTVVLGISGIVNSGFLKQYLGFWYWS